MENRFKMEIYSKMVIGNFLVILKFIRTTGTSGHPTLEAAEVLQKIVYSTFQNVY